MRVDAVDSTAMAVLTAARVAVQPAPPATPRISTPGPAAPEVSESPDVRPEVFLSSGVPAGQALAMYTLKEQLADQGSIASTLMTARAVP